MAERSNRATVQVGPQGRVVIPAPIRRALGLQTGDTLVAMAEHDRLVLEKPNAVLKRLVDRFRDVPPEVSLADEVMAERREETKRERSP